MQWLIDLMTEWATAQGYLTTSFVDRGDPSAYDFIKGNLTTDGTWHDLNLNTIVPTGAKAVALWVRIRANATGRHISFRKNGNVNILNRSSIRTQVAGLYNEGDFVVAIDNDRIMEYMAEFATWDIIQIVVKGWWL